MKSAKFHEIRNEIRSVSFCVMIKYRSFEKRKTKQYCNVLFQLQVRVKRLTRSQSAFVEFKLDKARPSKGYEFDVIFRDIGKLTLVKL